MVIVVAAAATLLSLLLGMGFATALILRRDSSTGPCFHIKLLLLSVQDIDHHKSGWKGEKRKDAFVMRDFDIRSLGKLMTGNDNDEVNYDRSSDGLVERKIWYTMSLPAVKSGLVATYAARAGERKAGTSLTLTLHTTDCVMKQFLQLKDISDAQMILQCGDKEKSKTGLNLCRSS